jgi:chromosome segregation ATPase
MSKISDFFARKNFASIDGSMPVLAAVRETHNQNTDAPDAATDGQEFSEIGSRIGEENEELRNLVIETERKIGELDELKLAFARIIEPVNKTLRTLEREKSHSASLAATLNETRSANESMRTELHQLEKKASSLQTENERLRDDLELAQQTTRGLESNRIELSHEIAAKVSEIGNLELRLAAETAQRQSLADDNRILGEQSKAADKRITQLETETVTLRQKLALSEDDNRSLQTSLDQTLSEVSRLSRLLTENGNTLTATQARLGQIETMFAETDAERAKLAATLDEAKERHRSETSAQGMRLDALQSRATTAERLLVEARQNLMNRAEEVRAFDHKAVEATIARNTAEKKLNQLEILQQAQERQIRDLEQSRTALSERSTALIKNLKTRETSLARAEERVQSLSEQVARLETDLHANHAIAEKRIEELNSTVQSERMDRAVAEGALEATRKDNARLQREISALHANVRRSNLPDEATLEARTNRVKSSGSSVEPIIKA